MDEDFIKNFDLMPRPSKPTINENSSYHDTMTHFVNEQKVQDDNISDVTESDQSNLDPQVYHNRPHSPSFTRSQSPSSNTFNFRNSTGVSSNRKPVPVSPSTSPPNQQSEYHNQLHVNFPSPPTYKQYHTLPLIDNSNHNIRSDFNNNNSTSPSTPRYSTPTNGYFSLMPNNTSKSQIQSKSSYNDINDTINDNNSRFNNATSVIGQPPKLNRRQSDHSDRSDKFHDYHYSTNKSITIPESSNEHHGYENDIQYDDYYNHNVNFIHGSNVDGNLYSNKSKHQQRRSDLANWAPSRASPAEQSSNVANLPDWKVIEGDRRAMTSLPTSLVQADLDYSMRHLLSLNVFEELIQDPLGRHRFREYLEQLNSSSIYKLDYWTDVDVFERLIQQLRSGSQALHDLYIAPSSSTKVDMPPSYSEIVFHRLCYFNELDSGLMGSQANLLQSLYENEFQNFIRHKLVERSRVRLGKENLSELERNGLSDSFVLTNPRLRDHPIVMSSKGFTAVTGFDRTTIIGRNCRFLQGPGTAPRSVQRIRDALNNAEAITELLLNYRRDGTPFFCLVNILPLFDAKGQVAYFIGGQVNVTGIISSKKNLSFLVGGSQPYISQDALKIAGGIIFSPTMQKYNNHEQQPESPARIGAGSVTAGSFDDRSIKDTINNTKGYDHFQSSESQKSSNIISRLFSSSQARKEKKAAVEKSSQRLPGAENTFGKEAQPIERQMEYFNHTYSKLMIVKREKREIVFVTKELLGYLGLPTETLRQCTDSILNHEDLLQLITCGSEHRLESKRIKNALKQAFKEGISLSITCGIKCKTKFSLRSTSNTDIKFGVLHATPLEDRDGGVYAYTVVFS